MPATATPAIKIDATSKLDGVGTAHDYKYKTIMTSVETFKTAVIRIRDILRGPGVSITGMDSMRHICLYLLSRYMTRAKVESLEVPEEFAWETLIETAQTKNGGVQKALDCFYHAEEDCLVRHFDRLFGTDKFSFDIKNPQKHKEILEILNAVNMADVDCQMDILGWVYEQHLRTGSSAARDLGQFFTDRFICEYMTELCKPGFKSAGVPESVCDPSMGTGGFLTAFIKYFKKHQADKPIDWSVQQKEIHGCDTDPKVAGVSRLNLFMETGGNRTTNLLTHDSLYGDLTQTGYDVILANMPFGLKGIKHAECCERVKALKIRGTKSEPLFLQLMMVSLNMGGRCAVVVPDGMLVNSSSCHNDTRKYLLDHFDLKRVIKMKGQFFMNTGIQPSILFFEKTGKPTEAVEFWEVVKGDKGEITETMVVSVPRTRIATDTSSSLDMRRYFETDAPVANPDGYSVIKLGELFNVKGGKAISKKDLTGTLYPYYGCNGINGYVDEFMYDGEYIICAQDGSIGSVYLVNQKFYPSNHTHILQTKDASRISNAYGAYFLKMMVDWKLLITSVIPKVTQANLLDIKIVVPPLPIQEEIVATLDRIYAPGSLRNTDSGVAERMAMDVKANMVAIMKSVESRRFAQKKLSEACDISKGKRCLEAVSDGGYPYQDVAKISRMVAKYILDTPAVLTPRAMSIGRFVYVDEKCHPSDDMFILKPKDDLRAKYLYYYCALLLSAHFKESLHGVKPTIDYSVFDYTTINIPPVEFQDAVLTRLEALQSQLTALESLQKQTEDNARFILESYLPTAPSVPLAGAGLDVITHEE